MFLFTLRFPRVTFCWSAVDCTEFCSQREYIAALHDKSKLLKALTISYMMARHFCFLIQISSNRWNKLSLSNNLHCVQMQHPKWCIIRKRKCKFPVLEHLHKSSVVHFMPITGNSSYKFFIILGAHIILQIFTILAVDLYLQPVKLSLQPTKAPYCESSNFIGTTFDVIGSSLKINLCSGVLTRRPFSNFPEEEQQLCSKVSRGKLRLFSHNWTQCYEVATVASPTCKESTIHHAKIMSIQAKHGK